MGKHLVAYYSRTGNNRYLAEKAAGVLGADVVTINPRISPFVLLLLASATGISAGNRKIDLDCSPYDSVILCGPIWMGQFVAPLKDFLDTFGKQITRLHFISCCGSRDSASREKFGYGFVFDKIKRIMNGRAGLFQAFPVELALPEEKRGNDQAMMEVRLNDSNFRGELEERFESFIKAVQ